MNIRLSKNKGWYHFAALLIVAFIMFCALVPRYSVRADSSTTSSTELGEDYQNYVAFKGSLAKTGYMSYYDHSSEDWLFPTYCKVKKDLTIADLSGTKIS